jgi:hypothetical protein
VVRIFGCFLGSEFHFSRMKGGELEQGMLVVVFVFVFVVREVG